jgi:hypothetical protein
VSTSLRTGLVALFEEKSVLFHEMVRAAGLDPNQDSISRDLRTMNFEQADLTGFDFSGSDRRGTGVRLAAYITSSTIFHQAKLDDLDRIALRGRRSVDTVPPASNPLPSSVHNSLSNWLGISRNSWREIGNDFSGTYTIFRPALSQVGRVLIGELTVTYDRRRRMITTREQYQLSELYGYMLRRSNGCQIFSKDSYD